MQETWVQSLGWEDPLEEGMATSILAWSIPRDRGAWSATVHGVAKSWTQLCDHSSAEDSHPSGDTTHSTSLGVHGWRGLLHLQTLIPYPRWKVIAKVMFASQTCHFSIWKIICCKENPFGWLHLKSYCSESCHTTILRSKETSGIKNFNRTHCKPEYNHVSC